MKTITIQIPDDFPEQELIDAVRSLIASRPDLQAKRDEKLRQILTEAQQLDLTDLDELCNIIMSTKQRKAKK